MRHLLKLKRKEKAQKIHLQFQLPGGAGPRGITYYPNCYKMVRFGKGWALQDNEGNTHAYLPPEAMWWTTDIKEEVKE